MKNILYLLFGIILIFAESCEDKASHPKVLSRPTIPDHRGINPGDTNLTYDSEYKNYRSMNKTNVENLEEKNR
ncbi:MAG: hypothetical protein H0W84_14200 [Bacteroidetes bacterium]|nr:hypothetical protein [Bacteroidota bacterium]